MFYLSRTLSWLYSLFFSRSLEICIVGLHRSGKTTFVRTVANDANPELTVPTVGFNMRSVHAGNVNMKVWDIGYVSLLTGGQPRFRSMWERYCQGVSVIIFVVDSSVSLPKNGSDENMWAIATEELHNLIHHPALAGIPLLVLATKNDLPCPIPTETVVRVMCVYADRRLGDIRDREVSCYSISSKNRVNIDATLRWLKSQSTSRFAGWL